MHTELIHVFSPAQLEKVANILKAIAHPLRLSIVELLIEQEELSVNDLCKNLESEQSLTSHHLKSMKDSGVLKSERKGQNIYYSLKLNNIQKIIDCMHECDLSDI